MALPTVKTYTVDEFEALSALPENRDRNLELIDGIVVEKSMPTDEHSIISVIFSGEFYIYAKAHGIGLPGSEYRFRVPNDARNSRQPDVSMIIDPNIPLKIKGVAERVPDVIVEVKSPDDTYDEMRDKAKFYIANGARLVLLAFPREKIVEVYRPGVPSDMLTIEDTIDGGDVLPGFSLPVANLFIKKRSG